MNIHWKNWCWIWNSNTVATWCKELTHLKRPWGWEIFKAGGEGDDRGWDGWMASLTRLTWIWANFRSCWRRGRPGVLQSMGLQRVGHDWAIELNWTLLKLRIIDIGFVRKDNKIRKCCLGLIPLEVMVTFTDLTFWTSVRKQVLWDYKWVTPCETISNPLETASVAKLNIYYV